LTSTSNPISFLTKPRFSIYDITEELQAVSTYKKASLGMENKLCWSILQTLMCTTEISNEAQNDPTQYHSKKVCAKMDGK
jgi:hypothetical protein